VRKNRTLTLTRDAADYLPAIRTAFEDLRRATERLQRPEREALLTVSTTTSLAVKWLVTRIASFQDAHPGIEVRLTTSSRPVDFQRDEVDMAVR
jgi:LysR family transcriptional regulator, glycine cleavage system transcriptional activator